MAQAGLEPATLGLWVPCSNQLSYWAFKYNNSRQFFFLQIASLWTLAPITKSEFKNALNNSKKNIVIICSFSYIFSDKMSSLFYKARLGSDKLILLVDEGEALLNSLHSSISICACKNRSFGTGIKGTVTNALCKSANILESHRSNR